MCSGSSGDKTDLASASQLSSPGVKYGNARSVASRAAHVGACASPSGGIWFFWPIRASSANQISIVSMPTAFSRAIASRRAGKLF